MRLFLAILLISLLAPVVHGQAGEFKPAPTPLPFGDFSGGGTDLFSSFGAKEPELLTVDMAVETAEIAADTPFRLFVTLTHREGAYSYWCNPGGPGVGTKVNWRLPEGFTVSGPEWPTPQRYRNGDMTFYVYKGRATLVYTVTPPKHLPSGSRWLLSGDVETQVCTPRSCNPLRTTVTAEVKGAQRSGTPVPMVAGALASLPAKPRGWRFEATNYDGELVIGMHPPPEANADPGEVYFFDAAAKPFVDSQRPQKLEKDGDAWLLRIPLKPEGPRVGEKLTGIIHAGNGWLAGAGSQRGYALDLPIVSAGQGRPPGLRHSVEERSWMLLLFPFLGGLILNVMPCVFPVIGLKIMGFARQAHRDRRAVFLHGLSYTAGVLVCFWTLAFVVITMGRGWGAQLQSDWFLFALCYVFMIMSMNMAGAFAVDFGVAGAGQGVAASEGLKRSFFTGLLATLTSTPCSAPFLGSALAYALSLPPLTSLGVFTLMALGFAFPYLALSLFPGWLKWLPKPGPWMDTFRQAMCFPLFATTAYLFWTLEAMLDEWRFLMLLFGLVLTAMACWLYGKHQKSRLRRSALSRGLMAAALAALAVGVWMGMPKSTDDLRWQDWSPELVERLRREGRPVYVDFTARWCATCQVNKRVYADPGLRGRIQDKNVALLKADWTLYDERITSTLRDEFNKAAIPVTVLYAPGEARGSLLPDILTVENVANALDGLP